MVVDRLSVITDEERAILNGRKSIDRYIYMDGSRDVISGEKLLEKGKLIAIRPHTRFIAFPEHTHDYVEMVYMCRGETRHTVNGNAITLRQGELLMLSQTAVQEIERAGMGDVAVNFIVLPQFFSNTLSALGEEETPLRHFLVDCLCGEISGVGYLHFRVSEVRQVQNLIENLILTLLGESNAKRKLSQMTMSVLFMELLNHTDRLEYPENEDAIAVRVLRYIDREYAHGSLGEAAEELHYNVAWLSRQIKRQTGRTFTELVQEKRLAQAAFLLRNTDRRVDDIAIAFGYENSSFFHRLFKSAYGVSPKHYRDGESATL
jgi:AraC-like DNA-binding protein